MKLLSNLMSWVDARFPATETYEYHMSKYYAPKNFNFWYFFGVLSMVVLVNQLVTGFWLTMIYTPTGDGAFDSIEYIMLMSITAGYCVICTDGSFGFFCGCLFAHVSWFTLRLISKTA